jgi:hypothetical protein
MTNNPQRLCPVGPDQAFVGFTTERDGNREIYLVEPAPYIT